MPTRRWALRNAAIFYAIALATLYIDVLAEGNDASPHPGAIFVRAPLLALFAVAATILFTLPCVVAYLVVLALIPARWPARRRRLAAVVASPILVALVEPGFIGSSGDRFYAASFLVGAVACGLAARLETRGEGPLPTHPREPFLRSRGVNP
jgi:hypothetical protein